MTYVALQFATKAHKNQLRRYTGLPYISHPVSVVNILKNTDLAADSAALAAAYLHDVVEDCGVQIETIREKFGFDVAWYVAQLSDLQTPADGNRAFRKENHLKILAKAGRTVQTIKCADILDNWISIREHDRNFAAVYRKECLALCEAMTEANIVLRKLTIMELEAGL